MRSRRSLRQLSSTAHPLSLLSSPPVAGVHGLRGVHNDANAAGQEYDDAISVTDASSVGGGSKTTSRRGSEATTDAGGSATDVRLAQQAAGLGLEDVIEAKAE